MKGHGATVEIRPWRASKCLFSLNFAPCFYQFLMEYLYAARPLLLDAYGAYEYVIFGGAGGVGRPDAAMGPLNEKDFNDQPAGPPDPLGPGAVAEPVGYRDFLRY